MVYLKLLDYFDYMFLVNDLKKQSIDYHIICGALLADELDAKRSIDEGARLGNKL